ncbi:hypothetical protein [Endozoicomonas sp. GU-1]|uniref:hypothetical protein n=1 Tax=Endozoicomonas sp. GU-1 TaxID=3009078 RepID=UPI0022B3AAB9|nr:hypothetical protein [Endozoicomonas sp. GU-1]WBA80956.1 hypothetical protein O2T12_22055 [Endozoicomonas sp. GU-1]WBA88524.1 hypothetical protein O3276_11255 [Endozoicomonas sp. GU-1]
MAIFSFHASEVVALVVSVMLYDVFSIAVKRLPPVVLSLWVPHSVAGLECALFGGTGVRCTDVIGLENQEITIQSEEVINNTTVIYGEQQYCILSYTRPFGNDDINDRSRLPFDVQVDGDAADDDFVLTNGDNTLPVAFQWRGGAPVSGASVWEEPGPTNLTSDQQGATSCDDQPFSQAWVRFELQSSALQSVQPGSYSGRFSVDIGQGPTGYHSDVNFTVNLPTLVKISGLDDMVLTGRGNNRYRQEEPFCVFVSGGGDYRIKASGGAEANAPFLLSNGSNTIPYRVRLSRNGSNLNTVNPGVWLDATGSSSSLNCNGGNNTKVRIVVQDNSVNGKPAGVYKGTLYLTVEAS